MGTAQAINFQPTGSGKAAITGDFVLIAKEVPQVLKALRENGIEVTASTTTCSTISLGSSSCISGAMTTRRRLSLKSALTHVAIAKG
jgi:uncharacterized protein DUF1259